jgi:hypothetical protein
MKQIFSEVKKPSKLKHNTFSSKPSIIRKYILSFSSLRARILRYLPSLKQ